MLFIVIIIPIKQQTILWHLKKYRNTNLDKNKLVIIETDF